MGTQTEIPCEKVMRGAIISPCGTYRYKLWRIWDASKPMALFIMLNPSTASETEDDPTIRRCINFANSWGYGGIYVGNLCAFRTTHPYILNKAHSENFDVIGPFNNDYIAEMARHSKIVIYAWGMHGITYKSQTTKLKHFLGNLIPHCISKTSSGFPAHPLYLHSDLKPIEF